MNLFKERSVAIGVVLFLSLFPLRKAIALSVEDRVGVNESYALEAQGQINGAVERMLSLNAHSNDYFVNYRLGWLFSLQKKYRNAIDHYEKAARIEPESVEPWLNMSSLYINLGNYTEALRASNELLKRNPKNYFGMLRMNLSLLRMKDYTNAIDKVSLAVKLYPTDAVFLEQKAYILKELGRNDEAREAVARLILVNPKNEFARTYLNSK